MAHGKPGTEVDGKGTCGNGAIDIFEDCDVNEDASCPGRCSAHCACPSRPPQAHLEYHMIDVGQGDSGLLITPDGFTLLIDTGKEHRSQRVLDYLSSVGIERVNYTLISHMHRDHFGGFDHIMSAIPGTVSCFDHGGDTLGRDYSTLDYEEYVLSAGIRRTTLSVGDTIDLGSSVTAEVLHAFAGEIHDNDNSIVLRVQHGDNTFLFGGDCQQSCESRFDPGEIDVYKVHHHGSSTSSHEGFVARMQPLVAPISVDATSVEGLPDPTTLSILEQYGARVFRTDVVGSIVFRSHGSGVVVNDELFCRPGVPCHGSVADHCASLTNANDLDCSCDDIVISQVAYDTPGDDTVEEFVELYNPTGVPRDLSGWSIKDNTDRWTLPAGTLIGAHSHLSIAADTSGFFSLYGVAPDISGLTTQLSNSGDLVLLLDDQRNEVDRVAWEGFEQGWIIEATQGQTLTRQTCTPSTSPPVDAWTVTSATSH